MDNQIKQNKLYLEGYKNGQQFALESFDKAEKSFNINGKDYIKGFIDGMESEYKRLEEKESKEQIENSEKRI